MPQTKQTQAIKRVRATQPKQTGVCVKLTDYDGNAFSIMGRVSAAMRRDGIPRETILEYQAEATSGDYDHLLAVTMMYVEVS
jgi:hypothetical protein